MRRLKQILRAIGKIKARYIVPFILIWLFFGPGMYALSFHEQVSNPRWIDEARGWYNRNKGYPVETLKQMSLNELLVIEAEVLEAVPYKADYETIPITSFYNSYKYTWYKYSCYVMLIFCSIQYFFQPLPVKWR